MAGRSLFPLTLRLTLPLLLAAAAVPLAIAAPTDAIVAPGATVQKLADGCAFTEGPAVDAEGNVYYSDCPNNRIMIYPPGGPARVWKTGTRGANGMMFDAQGRLVTCNSQLAPDGRTVTRFEKDGSLTMLAERYAGKKLNSPNDLAIDSAGRIYFTDPRYGDRSDLEQDRMAVYRLDPDGTLTRVIEDVDTPNGILITPDDRTIYLADHAPEAGGPRTLLAYDIRPDGSLRRRAVLHDFGRDRGIDGMALDIQGNIYATAGEGAKSGVYAFAPDGRQIAFIHLPEMATNCTFGGPGLRTLYMTAGEGLYSIQTRIPGFLRYPPLDRARASLFTPPAGL